MRTVEFLRDAAIDSNDEYFLWALLEDSVFRTVSNFDL